MLDKLLSFCGFFVEVVSESGIFLLALIRGRTRFGARSFKSELVLLAVQPLVVVGVAGVSLGLILSSQAARLLDVLNLESQMIQLIVLALVRDLAPVVAGIFVAGRGGLALAVHLGAMVRNREVDALILMDISRLRFVVAPTFCITQISMVAMTLWFSLLSVLAAGAYMDQARQIPITLFLGVAVDTLAASDLTVSVTKAMTIGLLVIVISAFNGLSIDRHARGLSRVAITTVVESFLVVIMVQLGFSLARV